MTSIEDYDIYCKIASFETTDSVITARCSTFNACFIVCYFNWSILSYMHALLMNHHIISYDMYIFITYSMSIVSDHHSWCILQFRFFSMEQSIFHRKSSSWKFTKLSHLRFKIDIKTFSAHASLETIYCTCNW